MRLWQGMGAGRNLYSPISSLNDSDNKQGSGTIGWHMVFFYYPWPPTQGFWVLSPFSTIPLSYYLSYCTMVTSNDLCLWILWGQGLYRNPLFVLMHSKVIMSWFDQNSPSLCQCSQHKLPLLPQPPGCDDKLWLPWLWESFVNPS